MTAPAAAPRETRVAPEIIVAAGCLIALVTFGPRASAGLFQVPMTTDYGWGRDVFGLAIAIQNLLWGVGQPFAGAIADRFGTVRVLVVGALLYAAGLVVMAYASTPAMLHLGAGVLIGFGLSGASFNLVLGAFGKLPPRGMAPDGLRGGHGRGVAGAVPVPAARQHADQTRWAGRRRWSGFGAILLIVLPLSLALATRPRGAGAAKDAGPQQSIAQALAEAFRHRSYVLLVAGFFTCGFQLAFITAHLPAYLKDAGLSAAIGGWTLAVIGLANAVGSLGAGYLSTRMPKRYLLAWIYLGRAIAITAFILAPASPASALIFGVTIGLLWLSTVPPTSALVMVMFGTRYMAMLYGFAFFSHQLGGFFGVLLGGVLYEATGGYALVWWLSVALGVASALINLPIVEKPVARLAAQPG